MNITMKKADLLAELKAKRRVAAEMDRKAAADFKAERSRLMKARRAWVKQLAGLSDADLARWAPSRYWGDEENPMPQFPSLPSCPIAVLPKVDRAIVDLERDRRVVFTVKDDRYDPIRSLLDLGVKAEPTICDGAA